MSTTHLARLGFERTINHPTHQRFERERAPTGNRLTGYRLSDPDYVNAREAEYGAAWHVEVRVGRTTRSSRKTSKHDALAAGARLAASMDAENRA